VIWIEKVDNDPEFDLFKNGINFGKHITTIRKITWIRLFNLLIITLIFKIAIIDALESTNIKETGDPLLDFVRNVVIPVHSKNLILEFTGSLILGFILSIVFLKFISFTETK